MVKKIERALSVGYEGPHSLLEHFNPFQIVSMPSQYGMYAGVIREGNQPLYVDFHLWKQLGLIPSTSVMIFGDLQSTKTTLAQQLAEGASLRKHPDGRPWRIRIEDTRPNTGIPEYALMARYLGYEPVDMATFRLNPLDPKMNLLPHQSLDTMESLLSFTEGRRLTNLEREAMLIGINKIDTKYPETMSPDTLSVTMSSLTFARERDYDPEGDYERFERVLKEKVLDKVRNGNHRHELEKDLAQDSNVDKDKFREACASVYLMIRHLMSSFSGVFGGEQSLRDMLRRTGAVLNLTGLNVNVRTVVDVMLWQHRNAAIDNDDTDVLADFELFDELWERLKYLQFCDPMLAYLKRGRGHATVNVKVSHGPNDADFTPNPDLALMIMSTSDVFIIGKMVDTHVDQLARVIEIPGRFLAMVPSLGKGEFVWHIPHVDLTFSARMAKHQANLEISNTDRATERKVEGAVLL